MKKILLVLVGLFLINLLKNKKEVIEYKEETEVSKYFESMIKHIYE